MESNESLKPDYDALLLVDLSSSILLELDDDLPEEVTDVLVVLQVSDSGCDHLLVFLGQDPVELFSVISSQCLRENDG